MKDAVLMKLRDLIDRHGSAIIGQPHRCEGLLRDWCSESPRECKVLALALKEGVAADLVAPLGDLPACRVARLSRRLQDNLGLAESMARWAVVVWARALGVDDDLQPPPPEFELIPDQAVKYGTPLSIAPAVKDPSGLPITLAATASEAGAIVAIQNGLLKVTPPTCYVGTFSVTVQASNGYAAAAERFCVTVAKPDDPIIQPISPKKIKNNGSIGRIEISVMDPSGLPVTLAATATHAGAVVAVQDRWLSVTVPAGYVGTFSITVQASNGYATAAQDFTVTVTRPCIVCWIVLFTVILVVCGGGGWLLIKPVSGDRRPGRTTETSTPVLVAGPTTARPEARASSRAPVAAQPPTPPMRADPPGPTGTSPGRDTAVAATARTPLVPPQDFVRPEDARKWIGKECTVEMTVRSTKDFDWGVILNSKRRYTDVDNLSVAIVKESAGQQFREQGIADLEHHFAGAVIQVTGKIEELEDKRTGRHYLEIKVRKADQIKKRLAAP
jgi:hypothetical protein